MEFLNRTKKAILQAAGIASPHVKPDARLVAAESKLTRLSTLVSHLEKGFQKYAGHIRSMAECGTLVAQDVQQFYQNAPERRPLAESFCDSHLSIESVASELFSAQFAELFDEFVGWRTEIERTLRELAEAADIRRDAVVLASQLRQMKDNSEGADDSRRRKVTQFLSNMGKKAPRSEDEAKEMIAQVQRDCERMGQMYRQKRAQLEKRVEKLIKSRMARFDQLWVKIMEYQMSFFRSGAAFTEGFQKHIDDVSDSLGGSEAGLTRVQTSDLDAAAVDVDKDEEKDGPDADDDSSDDEATHSRSKSRQAKQQRVASPKKNGRVSAQGEDPPQRQGDANSLLGRASVSAAVSPSKPRTERQESSSDLLGILGADPPSTIPASTAGARRSSPASQGSSTANAFDIFGSTNNILENHAVPINGSDPGMDLNIPTNTRNPDPLEIFKDSNSFEGFDFSFHTGPSSSSSSGASSSRAKSPPTSSVHDPFDPLKPVSDGSGSPKTMPLRRKNHAAPMSAPHIRDDRRRKEKSQTLKPGKQPSRSRSPHAAPRSQDQYVADRVKEGQVAAAAELKRKRAAEERLQEEKDQLESSALGDRLERWEFGASHGNRRQLKTLISDLPKILWPEAKAKWEAKNISSSKLLSMTNKNELKKIYFKACSIVHPDKVPKNDAATLLVSNRVFTALNSAWTEFDKKH